jgi:hypothetical protein
MADRIKLIERLLAILDKPDPEIDRAWADDRERHIDAYLRGDAGAATEVRDALARIAELPEIGRSFVGTFEGIVWVVSIWSCPV